MYFVLNLNKKHKLFTVFKAKNKLMSNFHQNLGLLKVSKLLNRNFFCGTANLALNVIGN